MPADVLQYCDAEIARFRSEFGAGVLAIEAVLPRSRRRNREKVEENRSRVQPVCRRNEIVLHLEIERI